MGRKNVLSKILTKTILESYYLKRLKTAKEIAEGLGVKEHNVLFYLKEYGIRKVERWERYGVKEFNKRQNEYLYGSLLGDDCLVSGPSRKHPYLQVIHSSKFETYVRWKYGFWKKLVRNGIKKTPVKLKDKSFFTSRFYTIAHPGFLSFYRRLYKNGKKQITREWLSHLTPLSLAIWYMDDGYLRKKRNRIHFISLAFGRKGNEVIKDYFLDKWNIKTNLQKASRGKDRYYIWMNTENSIKFTKTIAPYIIPCFSYKIDKSRELLWKKMSLKELGYIRDKYNIESPRLIAKRINRPVSSVHCAAWRLGLTQQRGGRKVYQFDVRYEDEWS